MAKYWVQFMDMSIAGPWNGNKSTLIDACGSDACIPLDGRLTHRNMNREALRHAQRHEHIRKRAAFKICKGERFAYPERESEPVILHYPIKTS